MESSFGETKPNKAPRQRAVRKSAVASEVGEVTKARTVRRTPAKPQTPIAETPEVARTSASSSLSSKQTRKAPTPISDEAAVRKNNLRQRAIVVALLLLGIGSSAAVGLTDPGQIDVLKTMEERNQRIRTNTADERDTIVSNVEVPVQNTSTNDSVQADGGLIGRGTGGSSPESTPEVATSTASSTDGVASSTEAMPADSATSTEEVPTEETPVETTDQTPPENI